MKFNPEEFEVVTNSDFLKTKKNIIKSISDTFSDDIPKIHEQKSNQIPTPINLNFGSKLSRGENYKGLPYVVFDHPNSFQRESTFAFRTMFWWAHEFSATIHLGGDFLVKHGKNIIDAASILKKLDAYICVNQTPWEYHFDEDNYLAINQIEAIEMSNFVNKGFLKIAIKEDLDKYEEFLKKTEMLYSIFLKCFHII